MKYYVSFLFLIGLHFNSWTQKLEIINDSVFKDSKCIGLIITQYGKKVAFFENTFIKDNNKIAVKNFDSEIKKFKVDKYIFEDLLIFDNLKKTVLQNEYPVGKFEIKIYENAPPIMVITIFKSEIQVDFVRYCVNKTLPNSITTKIKYDLSKEREIKLEYQRKLKRDKIIKERQRIERFYAQVYDKLGDDLDNIEGIYKSVDQGEDFEYDIAIFKSYENNREYVGLILSTTDSDLSIGGKILTFEKTAQANLFFGKYQTKGGTSYENKTASLNGAILKMGVKSFIKMYPAEGETRQYREINPMVDWQSSGSGVLINNKGFIFTFLSF